MQLPAGAQTWLSCGFDNAWTLRDYLTAALVDAVRAGNWQRAGDSKATKPEPVKRPADLRGRSRDGDYNDRQARLLRERRAARAATQELEEA